VCTLCHEFASFMPVYSEDVFDSNVQNFQMVTSFAADLCAAFRSSSFSVCALDVVEIIL